MNQQSRRSEKNNSINIETQIYNKSTTEKMLGMRTLTLTVIYPHSKFKAVKKYADYQSSKKIWKKSTQLPKKITKVLLQHNTTLIQLKQNTE